MSLSAPTIRSTRPSVLRVGVLALATVALLYALTVAVFGITDIVVQLVSGHPVLHLQSADPAHGGFGGFTTQGGSHYEEMLPGNPPPPIFPGQYKAVELTVGGVSAGAAILHALSLLFGALAQVSLAVGALVVGRSFFRGTPFSTAALRATIGGAVGVLVLGVAGQLVGWWANVTILDELGIAGFSHSLSFDPALVTVGLALLVIAIAFGAGRQLQRDTEGLV